MWYFCMPELSTKSALLDYISGPYHNQYMTCFVNGIYKVDELLYGTSIGFKTDECQQKCRQAFNNYCNKNSAVLVP